MLFYLILFVAGILGGFLAGLLGIGGGIIFISILPIALAQLGLPHTEIVQYTIANSIFGTFFASFSGCINLYRNKEFYLKETLWVSLGSITLSLLSLHFFVNTPYYSRDLFNAIVILMLVLILVQTLRKAKVVRPQSQEKKGVKGFLIAGVSGGTIASLTGLGGGTVIIPILGHFFKMDIKRAKAISLGVILFTSFIMTVFNLSESTALLTAVPHTGYIVFSVAIPMSLGVITTSSLGVRFARSLPSHKLSYIFAAFILSLVVFKAAELIIF